MKYLFLVSAFTFIASVTSYSQSNTFPSSGSVGIGTTSPVVPLHVTQTAPNGWQGLFQNGNSMTYIAHEAGYGMHINTGSNNTLKYALQIRNSAKELFYVRDDGHVGIGTISPTKSLDVSGDARIGNTSERHYLKISSTLWPELRFETPLSNEEIRIGVAHEDSEIYGIQEGDMYIFSLDVNQMPFILTKGGNILLNTSSGNTGIGTNQPDSKLTVNGNIHAKEVKVDLDFEGPDYVFESDYPLASLEDTKAYIAQNKHLPGIPSSDEMQQNGVNLLEMNMKLLEKVEELTLHLIYQNKQLQNLSSENIIQQKEIEQLKAIVK